MEARPVKVLATEEIVAAAAYVPGQVIELPDGRAAVVAGVENVASGARFSAIVKGDIEMACASATTFSAGADAQWDDGDNKVVASGGAGDFRVGLVKEAKTSGQLWVRIALNEAVLAMP